MRLTIIGCGDAFGSGGRANTCFLAEADDRIVALDFGATSLVELKRRGISPNRIDAIVVSHLHGDHFGGIPFLLLDSQFDSLRETPLTVVGPIGTAQRLVAAQEVFFPGSSTIAWRFPFRVIDLPVSQETEVAGFTVETREVLHASGAPATGIRLQAGGKILAYSGDTSWTDTLPGLCSGADLFIVDCHDVDDTHAPHMDFPSLEARRDSLDTPRIMLTHLSDAMLARVEEAIGQGFLVADDGLVVDL